MASASFESKTTLEDIKSIAVLAGGWSGEREVSLSSARGIVDTLQQSGKYKQVTFIDVKKDPAQLLKDLTAAKPDIIIVGIHGMGCEDGVLQGFLEMLQIPYTHSGVTASALGMDKVFSRILFIHAGIPVPAWELCSPETLLNGHRPFPFPWVVKPRSEGSSLGVSIVKTPEDAKAVCQAWNHGPEILVETYIKGQEIQTAVFEGQSWGTIEVRPHEEFYDYRAKYTEGVTDHIMPADVSVDVYQRVGRLAEKAYDVVGCRGVARCDFRYDGTTDKVYLLEINTHPGFTPLSLVPEIARYNGMSYLEVLEKMMLSALTHYAKDHAVPAIQEEIVAETSEVKPTDNRKKKSEG